MNSIAPRQKSSTQNLLHIREIPIQTTLATLRALFQGEDKKPKINYIPGTAQATALFPTHDALITSYESLNYSLVDGQILHFYLQDPSTIMQGGRAIFLRELSGQNELALAHLCTAYGNVLDVHCLQGGKAVIVFETAEAASAAIKHLDHSPLAGRTLSAEPYKPPSELSHDLLSLPENVLVAEGAPERITQAILAPLFPAVSIEVLEGRGIAILYFKDAATANAAFSAAQKPAEAHESTTKSTPESTTKSAPESNPESPEVNEEKTVATKYEGIKVSKSARGDVLDRIGESCSVFLTIRMSLDGLNADLIKAHMSSVGAVVHFDYKANPAKSVIRVEVGYSTPAARNEAIRKLDRKPCPPSHIPLRVLPFARDRSQAQVGILVLPELPLSRTYASLVEECSRFGHVVTAALCPLLPSLAGVVLFDRYSDAVTAADALREVHMNAFVYPPMRALSVLPLFADSERCPNTQIILYSLAKTDTESSLASSTGAQSAFIAPDFSAAVLSFADAASACRAFAEFSEKAQNISEQTVSEKSQTVSEKSQTVSEKCELVGVNTLLGLGHSMNQVPLPAEWSGRLLYATALPWGTSAREMREAAEPLGRVEAAIPYVQADGSFSGRGIVLMASAEDAEFAVQSYPLGRVDYFHSYQGYVPLDARPQPQYQFPDKMADKAFRPRQYLKIFVEMNCAEVRKAEILAAVQKLSIEELFTIVSSKEQIILWYSSLLK